jgi:SAM-dependent methyltransferase
MAQRQQVRRLLGGLDPGDPGHRQDIALRDRAGGDPGRGFGLHVDPAAGHSPPVTGLLGRDIDHPGPSERVKVREFGRHDQQVYGGPDIASTRHRADPPKWRAAPGTLCQAPAASVDEGPRENVSSIPHESAGWTEYLQPGGRTEPADPSAFRDLMRHPDYPLASAYDGRWVHQNLMGPNVLWLMESLTQVLALEPGMRVLDLGCGAAISSIFLAREFGVQVWATDLWIEPTLNRPRIDEAGVGDRVFPIEAEAHALPFAHGYFDALVSIDSYHYYGTDVRYLSYAAQFVRPGGAIGIVVPGNAIDPDDLPDDLVEHSAFGADYSTFRSPAWWARHWRRTTGVTVDHAEMINDGRELWHRHHRANAAWHGTPLEETGDEPLLNSAHGVHLGFARVAAHRTEAPTLTFGPGRFKTRIA